MAEPAGLPLQPESGSPGWIRRVPVVTGALAAFAGFLTVHGADLASKAVFANTKVVLYQAQASDRWTEFQADSLKKHMLDLTSQTTTRPDLSAKFAEQSKSYVKREADDRAEAERLEKLRDSVSGDTQSLMYEKDLTDYAGVAAQLGIALASVAALTKNKTVFGGGLLAGLAGAVICAISFANHFKHHGG